LKWTPNKSKWSARRNPSIWESCSFVKSSTWQRWAYVLWGLKSEETDDSIDQRSWYLQQWRDWRHSSPAQARGIRCHRQASWSRSRSISNVWKTKKSNGSPPAPRPPKTGRRSDL
jgi:hypothetical protein